MVATIRQPAETPKRTPIWAQLYVQVLVAITLGVLIGHFWPQTGQALKPLGDAFVKLVKMIIAPVIFLTVTTGIAGLRDLKKVGGVAAKAFAFNHRSVRGPARGPASRYASASFRPFSYAPQKDGSGRASSRRPSRCFCRASV